MTDPETTRVVRSWLEEGAIRMPDRVLDSVLDQLPTTPQRRSWRSAWRSPRMPSIIKAVVPLAAVILVVFVGFQLLPSSGGIGGPAATPSPTPSPTATPAPTITGTLTGQGSLSPGRYTVNAGIPGLTVAVPASWSTDTDWVVIGPRGTGEPDGMAIRFYQIDNLAKNPLSSSDGPIDPPLGPTVSDLAQAIVRHPGWTATAPTDVTIDGHAGKLVEFAIPLDAKLGADGQFCLSLDAGDCGIWGFAPGQTFDWYIVDVGGKRLIIDAYHYPGTSADDLAAQRAVVESVQFASTP
jgi:hypothetical protein